MSQAYLLSVETEKTEHRSASRWGPAVAGEKGETRVRVTPGGHSAIASNRQFVVVLSLGLAILRKLRQHEVIHREGTAGMVD